MRASLLMAVAGLAAATAAIGAAAAQEQPGRESVQRGQRQDTTPAPPAKRPPRMSNRCYTPAINCVQFEREPVGTDCWCVTPFGPSFGRIR